MGIKSSNRTYHEEHEEGYFASFTDLLVGILFIFIIMLMMFATNYQKSQKDTIEALTEVTESRNRVLNAMQESLKKDGIEVSIDIENGILRLPESLLFESGKWIPREGGDAKLKKLGQVLLKYLPCLANSNEQLKMSCNDINMTNRPILEAVLIEGHTDSKSFGDENGFENNWGLSAKRAITIYKLLTKYEPQLDNSITNVNHLPILGVSAYESRRPISTDLDPNRRIDLRFIMRSPTPQDIKTIEKNI